MPKIPMWDNAPALIDATLARIRAEAEAQPRYISTGHRCSCGTPVSFPCEVYDIMDGRRGKPYCHNCDKLDVRDG